MGALTKSAYWSKKTHIMDKYRIPPIHYYIDFIPITKEVFFKYFYLVTTSPISLSLLLPLFLLIYFLLAFSTSPRTHFCPFMAFVIMHSLLTCWFTMEKTQTFCNLKCFYLVELMIRVQHVSFSFFILSCVSALEPIPQEELFVLRCNVIFCTCIWMWSWSSC